MYRLCGPAMQSTIQSLGFVRTISAGPATYRAHPDPGKVQNSTQCRTGTIYSSPGYHWTVVIYSVVTTVVMVYLYGDRH